MSWVAGALAGSDGAACWSRNCGSVQLNLSEVMT